MIFHLSILLILSGLKSINSLSHELCKTENGYMTLSEKSNILSSFKNENATNTIFIDLNRNSKSNEEFNFICHRHDEIVAKHVLKTADLQWNDLFTNKLPHSVNCDDLCEVIVILVEFDATSLCNDRENVENWKCGLDLLDKELYPPIFRSGVKSYKDEDISKKFVIYSEPDLPPLFEFIQALIKNLSKTSWSQS